jgi:hypothetical protein
MTSREKSDTSYVSKATVKCLQDTFSFNYHFVVDEKSMIDLKQLPLIDARL